MKMKLKLLTLVSMFAVLISSCKKDPEPTPIVYGDARVSVTNTVTGSDPQDFYQNDTKKTTNPVAYGETSPIFSIKAGNTSISFKNTGTTVVKATMPVGLETDASYSIFYYVDPAGTTKITGFGNDNIPPAIGKYKVRFLNLGASLNNSLNISLADGTSILNGLGFGNATATYATIDVGTSLAVGVAGSGLTIPIPSTNFVSGKNYTVWFDAATTTTAKFHVIQQN